MIHTTLRALCLTGLILCPPAAAQADIDSLEGLNRPLFAVNDAMDQAILKPAATIYVALPDPLQTGVHNFFSNLGEISNTLNNFLQGKPEAGASSAMRFLLNSTIGLGGLIDVATDAGFEEAPEDFGQTLAVWGMGSGSYLVLPIFGPSTLRDTLALPVDLVTNPIVWVDDDSARVTLALTRAVDKRAEFLQTEEAVAGLTEDRYLLIRNAYLQKREFDIADGDLEIGEYFDE